MASEMEFFYQGHRLRVAVEAGEARFDARDVAAIFGIRAPARYFSAPGEIDEASLYDDLRHSRKPGFNPFYRWLMSEVAPSLTQAGAPLKGEAKERGTNRELADEVRPRRAQRLAEEAEVTGTGPETEGVMRSAPAGRAVYYQGRGGARYTGNPRNLS
ncbi:hypothetical protein ABZ826_23765 [Streptomyces sp. NPDC047515]|uniref:BRO-N domain-containing protein n=1 Tax=Streptomyces sp. NPDC047515 TaxID=3155380 RepID=UPI00341002A3